MYKCPARVSAPLGRASQLQTARTNPMGSPDGSGNEGDPYGGFRYAQRKTLVYRHSHFSEPIGSSPLPYGVTCSKKAQDVSCAFLLVTRTGLEPMLPP